MEIDIKGHRVALFQHHGQRQKETGVTNNKLEVLLQIFNGETATLIAN